MLDMPCTLQIIPPVANKCICNFCVMLSLLKFDQFYRKTNNVCHTKFVLKYNFIICRFDVIYVTIIF
jgi:hypothetical protein